MLSSGDEIESIMMKQYISAIIVSSLIITGSVSEATTLKARDILDSGGQVRASSQYHMAFQSIGPVINQVSQTEQYQLIQGTHFSGKVHHIAGYNMPFERDSVTINANTSGILRTMIQFQAENIDGIHYDFSTQFDDTPLDGGESIWDSNESISSHDIVKLKARVHDGLSWSEWRYTFDEVIVDNLAPIVTNPLAIPRAISPTNETSIGIKDNTQIEFNIDEPYLKSWDIQLFDENNKLVKTFSNTTLNRDISVFWDGLNLDDTLVDEGYYAIKAQIIDQVDHVTEVMGEVIVDDTSPTVIDFYLNAEGKELNSSSGELSASWIGIDEFDAELKYDLSMSHFELEIKQTPHLSLWLDSSDESTLAQSGSKLITWLDKSSKGNDLEQFDTNLAPTLIDNTISVYGTIQFSDTNEGLISKKNSDPGTKIILAVVHNGSAWNVIRREITQDSSGPLNLGPGLESSLVTEFDMAELLVFDNTLSIAHEESIMNYLTMKWQLGDSSLWDLQAEGISETTWGKDHAQDSRYYQLKIAATDDAGNVSNEILSNTRIVPDRTPPVIDDTFIAVYGVEDEAWVEESSQFKFDNLSAPSLITWEPSIIFTEDDPIRSSEEVLQTVQGVNSGQDLEFIPKLHANTDPNVSPEIDGNIYGKAEAWVRVRLEDTEGNYTEKDIQVYLQPVNDPPEFIGAIGEAVKWDSNGNIIYNIKFDEDTDSPIVQLDDYILDVDNLKSELSWVLESENYYLDMGYTPGKDRYISDTFELEIGPDITNHSIEFFPDENWYGDENLTLSVTDPSGLSTQDNITIRVWPVNEPPIINDSLFSAVTINEDIPIVLTLTEYEDDVAYEDRPPTNNNLLKWSVLNYDDSFIEIIEGENSANDTLTFRPINHQYGTTTITLALTDTDTVAASVFPPNTEYGGYIASPLQTTKEVTFTWYPINDAPDIGSIPDQIQEEDVGVWTLDLTTFKSDVEDLSEVLLWDVDLDTSLVSYNFNALTNVVTFTSKENAWGTTPITLYLTDKDENINFESYVANPLTSVKEIALILNPVNDLPSLETVSLKSAITQDPAISMATDTLSINALGYSDVGYSSGNRTSSHSGDEYNTIRHGELGFNTNAKYYHYKWFVDGNLVQYTQETELEEDSLQVTEAFEGKNITVEVWPDDGEGEGDVLTATMFVNNRPLAITQTDSSVLPLLNHYTNTTNIQVSWPTVTDLDDDDIGYRIKIWKVDKWNPPPENPVVSETSYYDSEWFYTSELDEIQQQLTQLEHGTYYWKVWTGNAIQNSFWDYRLLSWINYFHVDLINPTNTGLRDFLQVNEIVENAVLEEAGNTRVLYGRKPSDVDDEYHYKIEMAWENDVYDEELEDMVITTGSKIIVPFTTSDAWTYIVSYPDGITTFNIFLIDLADNITSLNTFTTTEDTTPPVPFTFNGAITSEIEVTVSRDYYFLQGEKEPDSGIYYSGYNARTKEYESAQIVGFTNDSSFSLFIYPEKPSGNLYTIDRAGNKQALETNIAVSFLRGVVPIKKTPLSRDIVNAKENETALLEFGITQEQVTNVIQTSFSFSSPRHIKQYSVINKANEQIVSGEDILSGTTINITIEGSKTYLNEGDNRLILKVEDVAGNIAEEFMDLRLQSTPPDTDIFLVGSEISTGIGNLLKVFGKSQENVNILVNNNNVTSRSSSGWVYIKRNFDVMQEDVNVTLVDDVYNAIKVKIWDNSYYTSYLTYTDIPLPIRELDGAAQSNQVAITYQTLPENIKDILVLRNTLSALMSGALTQSVVPDFKLSHSDMTIPDELVDNIVQVVARDKYGNTVGDVNLDGHNVIISIPFDDVSSFDASDLVMIKYNASDDTWYKNENSTTIDDKRKRIYSKIDVTGLYGIAELNAYATNITAMRLYPNPWVPHDNNSDTGDETGITFDQLMENSHISIYTLTGELVIDYAPDEQQWVWDGTNKHGDAVFSGVYLYVVKNGKDIKTGKLTIIK